MAMSLENLRKQKALYHCLESTLGEQQALEALVVWQDKYAQNPGFSVRYFADDVSRISGGRESPKSLVLNMVTALAKDVSALADPSEKIDIYRLNSGRYFAGTNSTHVDAFNLLFNKIFALADHQLSQVMKEQLLRDYLPKSRLSPSLKAHLVKGMQTTPFKLRLSSATPSDLKTVINYSYVIMCTLVGPNKADSHFSLALRKLESNGGAQYTKIYKELM